ncbi:MAG TPA: nitroreductase family deazaflavin-dependent oxidoreductase [Candidatus Limnocylindrales bacterium]|nr:nitroreductase family deazaflavin-dependent oxidoreductase [Candidatus Limnocylindrales bacterium]
MTDSRTTPRTPAGATAARPAHTDTAPWLVRAPNRVVRWLLAKGVPMGPNVSMTVVGRTSSQPRTFPVAISPIDGRQYVIGAYGDVNWTRNLRAAGEATINDKGGARRVTAHALSAEEATRFYAELLPAYIAHFPKLGQVFGKLLFGSVAPEILNDPAKAAQTRPVFELRSE